MNVYIREITRRLSQINAIVSKPIKKASISEAQELVLFATDYGDVTALVDNAKKYAQEDAQQAYSDYKLFKEKLDEFFGLDRDKWISTDLSTVIAKHLKRAESRYTRKLHKAEKLEQAYSSRAAHLRAAEAEELIDRHVKAKMQSQNYYDLWQAETESYSSLPNYKFIYLEALLIQLSNVATILVNAFRTEQSKGLFYLEANIEAELDAYKRNHDFVDINICAAIYDICKEIFTFSTLSDFVYFMNLKTPNVKICLKARQKLRVCDMAEIVSQQVNSQVREAWKESFLKNLGIKIENAKKHRLTPQSDIYKKREVFYDDIKAAVDNGKKMMLNHLSCP